MVSATSPKAESLSILQWNVWYRAQPERIASHLLRIIEEYGLPDVLCLQEVTEPAVDTIANAVGARSVSHAITRTHPNGTIEGQAIMSTRLLGRGLESGVDTVLLSRGGRAPFKASGSSVRVLQKAMVPVSDGRTIVVANTHTSYLTLTNASQRRDERGGLLSALRNEEDLVLTGDFNASSRSAIIKQLGKSLVRPELPEPTWTSSHFDKVGLFRRSLDHVFVSPSLELASISVLGNGPSDHSPVFVEVRLPHED